MEIVSVITVLLLFVSLLLFGFLVSVKSKNKRANGLLAAYFLIFSIHISVFFYARYIELPMVIERLRDQIMFFSSPLLYLYLLASIYADFRLKPKHLLHITPFLIDVSIFIPRFYGVDYQDRIQFLASFSTSIEWKLSAVFAALVSVFYLTLMYIELIRYRRLLEGNHSNKTSFNFKWLLQLTILLTIIFVGSQLKQLYIFFGKNTELLNLIYILLTLSLLGFLTWIVFKSLYHPALFRNIDSRFLVAGGLQKNYNQKKISTELKELDAFMIKEEPFLDDSLSLQKLAHMIGQAPKSLSVLINQSARRHFFDFINQYRIEKAKKLLEEDLDQNLTVQQIMYEVGFNSKSSFYTAFKKHTDQTPLQYKKAFKASKPPEQ